MLSLLFKHTVFGLILAAAGAACAMATTVVPPEFATMVNRSDLVIRAKVLSMRPEIRSDGVRRKIYTKIEVQVLEVITGQAPDTLTLEFLGGQVGEEEMIVDGMPRLETGGESILFVSGNGRALCPLYAMSYGYYPIAIEPVTKRRYMARGNQMPLAAVAEVSQPLTEGDAPREKIAQSDLTQAMSPEEFVQKIKAAKRAEPSRAKTH